MLLCLACGGPEQAAPATGSGSSLGMPSSMAEGTASGLEGAAPVAPASSGPGAGSSSGETPSQGAVPAITAPVDQLGLTTVTIRNAPNRVISRLTREQYLNSVAALLGEAALVSVAEQLPDLIPNGGFSNSGWAQSQPYELILGFDAAARQVVSNVADWAQVHTSYGGCTEYACVDTLIARFGEAAFRRPLEAEEIAAFAPIVTAAQAEGLPYDGAVKLLVRAMLQAPEFIYLFEDEALTPHQLASRLSFFLTDGPPDPELYALASSGELADPLVLEQQSARLLGAGAARFARAFAHDLLWLRRVHQRVVSVEDGVLDALVQSAEDTFAQIVVDEAPVAAVLDRTRFVVNEATAGFMGVPATSGVLESTEANGFVGLLTHPATLIAISNAVEGSTVSRGQFIAHQLLCVPPLPPPPEAFTAADVAGELPPNPTQRDEAEARLADPSCSVCHLQFEPYAFGLNKWGGDGTFKDDPRLIDSGPITTSLGTLTFSGYQEFLPLLAASEQFQRCMTDQLVRYALRHTEYPADTALVVLQAARAESATPSFGALARAIVREGVFTVRSSPPSTP